MKSSFSRAAMMLAMMLIPWVMNAQVTITIGEGTETTSSNVPFYTGYDYSFVEQIYFADEIQVDNETIAGDITSVSFYHKRQSGGEASITHSIVLYMKNVTRSSFASDVDYESVTASDIVYSGDFTIPYSDGWITITLPTPFHYDGSSNLLVAMDENSSGNSSRHFTSTSKSNCVIAFGGYNDSTYPNPDPYDLSAFISAGGWKSKLSYRANIQLTITPTGCVKPSSLVADPVTAHAATLTWSGGSGTYNVEYKKASETDWTSHLSSTTLLTTTLTNLDQSTAYEARVQSVENSEVSSWKTVSFTTQCEAITITESNTYSQDFEGYTGVTYSVTDGVVPACWDSYATNSSHIAPHIIGSGSYHYVHEGTNALSFYGYGNCYAALPEFTNALSELQISFWMQTESSSNGNLTLGYITAEDENFNTFTEIETYARKTSSMVQRTTYLNEVPTTATRLVFRWYYDSQYSCCIDDVEVSLLPTCMKPTSLSVTATTKATATLSWTENGEASQWQICLNGDENNLISAKSNPFTIEGLTAGTSYTAKLRAYCSADDQSEWSNEVTFDTPESCPRPLGLAIDGITDNTATLTWTENGEATSWQVCLEGNEEAPITVTEKSHTFTGLNASTEYTAKVRAIGNDEYSAWVEITFQTTAVAEVVGDNWSDNFEGTSCGWEFINGDRTNAWAWGEATNNGGTHALYISNDEGTTNAYTNSSSTTISSMVYATILLNFAKGKYEFSYDWKANGEGSYDYLRVALVPLSVTLTAGTSAPSGFSTTSLPTDWIALDGGSKLNLSTDWQSKTLTINVAAGNYYLVVAWRNDGSGGYNPPAAIDNVIITKVACSADVEDLGVSDIDTNTAILTWTPGEATQWQVAYSTASNFEGATEAIVSEASYSITGLQSGTHYYARVRAYCGGENFGTWSDVLQFNTNCEAVTNYPWTENFDGITVSSSSTPSSRTLPICWSYINECTNNSYKYYPTIYNSSSDAKSNPNSLRLYSSYYSDPKPQYAILPPMESLKGKQITLYAKGIPTASTFKIGTMGNPADASTFTLIAEQTLTTSYPEDPFEYIIPSDCTDGYVAIMIEAATSSRTTNAVYIDDIVIREAPTCFKPTGLSVTASSVTSDGATITWTAGGSETSWQIEYATDDDFTNPSYETVNGEPTYTFHGLADGTTYYVHVQADCGGTDRSEYSKDVNFTTIQSPVNLPYSNDFETANDWLFVNGGLTNAWAYGEATNNGGTHAIYVSNDGGTTNAYTNTSATMVYATKTFNFDAGTYIFSYDWKANGEGSYDYLRVALVPSSVTLTAGSIPSNFSISNLPTDWIALDGGTKLNLKSDWQSFVSNEINIATAGTYMMVFAWKNDTNNGSDSPAAVDNVSIEAVTCLAPTGLAIAENSVNTHGATITWDEEEGATFQWKIATEDEWTETQNNSVVLSGLTPETDYTFTLRKKCSDTEFSQEVTVTFTTTIACPVPTALTCTKVTASTAELSWTENGEATNWEIEYGTDATFESYNSKSVEGTPSVVLESLTPETVYYARVRSYIGDDTSIWSATFSFEPTEKLVIGSGTGTSGYLPTNTNYNYSNTQQIYTVEELGNAGVIESIDFYMTGNSYTRNLDIYMVSTDKENFTGTTDWIAVTEEDLVFSGEVTFSSNVWTTITLNAPFVYDGTQNVAIIVDDNTGEWSPRYFRTFTATANQALFFYQDNNNIDPNSPSASYKYTTNSKNQIRIMKSAMGDCMKPTNVKTTEVGPDFATLSWTENGAAEEWVVVYNGNTVTATTNDNFMLEGLDNETEYTVYVYPTCDASLQSKTITFTTRAANPVPFDVTVSEVKTNSAHVAWSGYSDSYLVKVGYQSSSDFVWEEHVSTTEKEYTFNGLNHNTDYSVQVLGVKDGNTSEWSAAVAFTTPNGLAVPTDLAAEVTATTATLSWTGVQDIYNVRYRTNPSIIEGFEDADEFSNWQAFGTVNTNTGSRFGRIAAAASTGTYGFSFSSYSTADDYNQYLISPELSDVQSVDFYYRASSSSGTETFRVGYSTTGIDLEDFTWGEEISTESTDWSLFEDNDVPAGVKYVAINYYSEYEYELYIDDLTIHCGDAGEWVEQNGITSPLAIDGLEPQTRFEWQVQGIYTGTPTDWSEPGSFTTSDVTRVLSETDGITAEIASEIAGKPAQFTRSFTSGVASTICLPFPMNSEQAEAAGTFYTFVGVSKQTTPYWTVTMQEPVSNDLSANTPYLFVPSDGGEVTFSGTIGEVPSAITAGQTTADATDAEGLKEDGYEWQFKGTYEERKWDSDHHSEEIGSIYGFAANNKTVDGVEVSAGDFVKVLSGAYVPPFRAYLKYADTSIPGARTRTGISEALPDRMTVRLLGKNGEIDGIGEIDLRTGEVTFDSNAWYDLSGRKLDGKPTKKGVYINNRKVITIK